MALSWTANPKIDMLAELRQHSANVDAKHVENLRALSGLKGEVSELKVKVDETSLKVDRLERIRPDIEVAVQAEKGREWRKKHVRRVIASVLATLLTVSALIPLISWLLSLRLFIYQIPHSGGG